MAARLAILFIPDISGFSTFVQKTEVEHSRHIISELLELLIDSNEMELELAEIEGDALFFFHEGSLPSREAVLSQVEKMFLKFHEHLLAYKYRRICRCGACTSASELNLKFVVHAGHIDFIKVKNSRKPFGPPVVLAHRLLKNSISSDEYALLSQQAIDLLPQDASLQLQMTGSPERGRESYDVGDQEYLYYSLTPLQKLIPAPVINDPGERVKRPWSFHMTINAPVEEVYDTVSNFDRRLEWNKDVAEFKYRKGEVNRVGTEHKCVVNDKVINFETITADFDGKLVYGERTREVPIVDQMSSYFILEPISRDQTGLTIELHPYARSPLRRLFVPILKLYAWKTFKRQFSLIKTAAESGGR